MDIESYSKMVFKCDREGCNEEFTLNGYLRHMAICSQGPSKCTFGCADQTLMKGRKQHLQHAQDACPMVPVVCRECEFKDLKK